MHSNRQRPQDIPTSDGRNIDPALGTLSGEGSSQITEAAKSELSREHPASPSSSVTLSDPTYYDRPLLKEPVWGHEIPLYYFIGGAAGTALALAAAAQAASSADLGTLIRRGRWMGIAGASIGGVLLILDLGRPSRFLNMLRVFRPTSPMNMGAWILSAVVPTAGISELFRSRRGLTGAFGRLSGYIAGLAGLGLATYTGVLVSNSAIPFWQASRRTLPLLFGASGVSAAASLLELMPEDAASTSVTRNFAFAGRASELALSFLLEKQVRVVPRVAEPLHKGASGLLWRAAAFASAGSVVASLLPKRFPAKRFLSGILGAGGSMLLRYAIHQAGIASARDPRATFYSQREGD
jgi:formate-dependent nitrite reductase membrane component NrfD